MTTLNESPPVALLREEHDLPFVDFGGGVEAKLLQVDLDHGVWIVRNRLAPGTVLPTHRHTGAVHAFTESGTWFYREYPESVNRAGSYLFEPAGSVHTLTVPDTNTEDTVVLFHIVGANLDVGADGTIGRVVDAHSILERYREEVLRAGLGPVSVIGDPAALQSTPEAEGPRAGIDVRYGTT